MGRWALWGRQCRGGAQWGGVRRGGFAPRAQPRANGGFCRSFASRLQSRRSLTRPLKLSLPLPPTKVTHPPKDFETLKDSPAEGVYVYGLYLDGCAWWAGAAPNATAGTSTCRLGLSCVHSTCACAPEAAAAAPVHALLLPNCVKPAAMPPKTAGAGARTGWWMRSPKSCTTHCRCWTSRECRQAG